MNLCVSTRFTVKQFAPVLFHAVSGHYGHVLAFKNGFLREQQRERIYRLEFLEDRFKNLILMHEEKLQTWKTLKSQEEPVHKRIYKGEVFNWEECVDWWGYYYKKKVSCMNGSCN